jgi:hypothetical protein
MMQSPWHDKNQLPPHVSASNKLETYFRKLDNDISSCLAIIIDYRASQTPPNSESDAN